MDGTSFQIAPTTLDDLPPLHEVHKTAFGSDLEARLVELLIAHSKAAVSLKATVDDQLVGHILFSPVTVGPDGPAGTESLRDAALDNQRIFLQATPLGLAPLAVLPAFHRRGIGAALAKAGLAACEELNAPWVVVLGDPAYYSRFGFTPASRLGLACEFGGDGAFQILVLDSSRPPRSTGLVRYADEFRSVF